MLPFHHLYTVAFNAACFVIAMLIGTMFYINIASLVLENQRVLTKEQQRLSNAIHVTFEMDEKIDGIGRDVKAIRERGD